MRNVAGQTTLDTLELGKDAIIESVDCAEVSLRKHILDMGLTPGTEVTFVKCAPLGDPMEVRLRGYELTLRKEDAAHIAVRDVHEAHNLPRKNPHPPASAHPGKGEAQPRARLALRASQRPKALTAPLTFALAGNQNCGKTTLFNQAHRLKSACRQFPGRHGEPQRRRDSQPSQCHRDRPAGHLLAFAVHGRRGGHARVFAGQPPRCHYQHC